VLNNTKNSKKNENLKKQTKIFGCVHCPVFKHLLICKVFSSADQGCKNNKQKYLVVYIAQFLNI
jgi:hypothetical protein